jgi:hypothetical protein
MNVISHMISILIIQKYAKHMKELRALNYASHCSGENSYIRIKHEDV